MTDVLRIAERVLTRGINVVATPGCESRGNGSAWAKIECHINHHTAGPNNVFVDGNLIDGVPGLSGPLCNFCIMYDGDLGIIAAYPANHAGASGGWDTAPAPVTNDFNRRALGTEIQYRGIEPMSDAQWRTMCILNHEINTYFGWPANYIRCKTHNGTSIEGKWDPGYAPGRTYDVNVMRRAMAEIGAFGASSENPDSAAWKFAREQMLGAG